MTNLWIILMTNSFLLSPPSGEVRLTSMTELVCARVEQQVNVLGRFETFTNYTFIETNIYDPVWVLRVPTNRPKLQRSPLAMRPDMLPPAIPDPPTNKIKLKKGKL